jgi:uncharacterized protein (TIGR02246 family)
LPCEIKVAMLPSPLDGTWRYSLAVPAEDRVSPHQSPNGNRSAQSSWAALALAVLVSISSASAEAARIPLLITVDDLPLSTGDLHADPAERERITHAMLAALAAHEVPAVGMVTWGNVRGPADLGLLELWLEAGVELGDHTDRHLDYHRTETAAWIADAETGRRELAEFLAARGRPAPRFFRFPMLREGDTPEKLDAARAWLGGSGQRNLPVTLDNQDWSFERPWVEAERSGDGAAKARVAEAYHEALHLSIRHHEATAEQLFGRRVPQVLLLHATAVGAAQWDRLFGWLAERGYRFARADEVLADPAYVVEHRFLGPRGPGLWDRLLDARRRAESEAAIRTLLAEQAAAWSRGDLEAFVSVYAEDALFVSPSGLTRGRDEVLARYRRRYPDRAAMGRLSLDVIEFRLTAGGEVSMLGDAVPGDLHGARVVARWTLAYPEAAEREEATGLTLIVFERRGGEWRIVEDASM